MEKITALIKIILLTGILVGVIFAISNMLPPYTPPIGGIADHVEMNLPATAHIVNLTQGWQGSGFIISEDGLVVTAKHVVDSGEEFKVTLNDGREFYTDIVVEDEEHDAAFLKIDAEDLPVVKMAAMQDVRPGDAVFIIGSPFGYENFNSVSLGIMSCTKRGLDGPAGDLYGWAITFQTDSMANPGNSGGPVFNNRGQVIGILVAGITECVNYAVPVEVFMDKLDVIKMLMDMQRFDERMEPEEDEWSYHSYAISE